SSAGNLDGGALIRAGQRVELVMQAPGMRISTPVTALERGRAGQKIRVRSIPAGKLLVATVISAQLVEVDY
ncbi:MAG: flagella basal body P-ring formation protein FlgA, partial [Candidatus Acidiferrales bacterium]